VKGSFLKTVRLLWKVSGLSLQSDRPKMEMNKMFTKNSYRGIDPELVKMVRKAAKKAVRKGGLSQDELPDIEQELMIAMLSAMEQHDPGKSNRKTFLTMLLKRRLSAVYRQRLRPSKKFQHNLSSLSSEIEIDGDTCELIELVNSNHEIENNPRPESESCNNAALRMDLEGVLGKLPPDCWLICDGLKTMNITELAEYLKTTRGTLHKKLEQIRSLMEKQGLSAYLPGSRTNVHAAFHPL
jgi:RNA polymerase sigma factor (sigma-70 family)